MLPAIQANTTSLAARIAQAKRPNPAGSGGMAGFLKFNFNDGSYLFGRDQEDTTGDIVLVNTNTICHGWVLWADGKANKSLATFDQDMPEAPKSIGDNHPSEARAFGGAFVDDGKPGAQFVFETNSYGGRKGVDALISAIIDRVTSGETVYLYPMVRLGSDSYRNKNYMNKLIHNPVFEIVKWCDVNGVEAGAQTAALSSEETAADEPPFETEPPVQRRRRVA